MYTSLLPDVSTRTHAKDLSLVKSSMDSPSMRATRDFPSTVSLNLVQSSGLHFIMDGQEGTAKEK